MTNFKQTPLYDLHLALGAKMTTFAGYALPVHYGQGIIREHLHCRSRTGLFDISHMGQCRLDGEDAAGFLEKLTPGGIFDLAVGRQKYTLLTNAAGGVIDDLIVTRTASGLSLIVNAACREKDFAYLRERLPKTCRFEACTDWALLALQGPEAAAVMAKFSQAAAGLNFMQACNTRLAAIDCRVSRSGYCGEDGFEIAVPAAEAERLAYLLLAEPGVEAVGLGARDTLRLEAGLCLYGHELSETITPIEAGLSWVFKKGHRDFPGAEILLAQKQDGPQRRRVGLVVNGKLPVREGGKLFNSKNQPVGYVTSGSFSPSLGRPVAMALVDKTYCSIGTNLSAQVRDALIAVTVSALPFVAHRYRRPNDVS